MRICYLGENGSVHNQKWIEALSKRGEIELHVVTFDRGMKFNNVRYHFLKRYLGNRFDYFLNIFRLKKILCSLQPDLLHAQYATSYGYMAARTGFHPCIVTGWGADIFDSPKQPMMRRIVNTALSHADAITVLSEITAREVRKLCGRDPLLIPFGVDTEKFKPGRKDDGKIRIGTIRTLTRKYGVETLIRAFASVSERHPDVILDIVGDGELRQQLQQLTRDLGIDKKVNFHGFVSQQKDFDRYYSLLSQLDIFAILSVMDSETFGVAAVEASSCGIPVVATRVGGLPEVVQDGVTGILVGPEDVDETVAAMERLVADSNTRKSMGEAGRNFVLLHFDWKKSVDRMIELYNKLVNA